MEEEHRPGEEGLSPVEELISHALDEDPDEHAYWNLVEQIQHIGAREVLDAAGALTRSESPRERSLGAHILGKMGESGQDFAKERLAILDEMLEIEEHPQVLESMASALGHLPEPRAAEALAGLKDHPDPNVRFEVALGLGSHSGKLVESALIELSGDDDPDVRDWATFGLADPDRPDSPEIREALARRLSDEDIDTRTEALLGLAARHDERAIEPLIQELSSEEVPDSLIAAAEAWGDPRLKPALERLAGR